jgi:nucleotide-binding universal stress UspA family protein
MQRVARDSRSASAASVRTCTLVGVIIVGVDGSDQSRAALEWAVREARLRQDTIRVLCAWHVEAVYGAMGFIPPITSGMFERAARKTVANMLEAQADAIHGIAIERSVVQGPAAEKLVEAADDTDAALIVVGSHGHGTILTMLLGSVSLRTLHLASCPVVVVRSPASEEVA